MFSSKPKSFLGIDLGAGGVKLVELKGEKNRPVLFTYGLTSEAQDVHRILATRAHIAPHNIEIDKDKNIRKEKKDLPEIDDSAERVEYYAGVLQAVCREAKISTKTAVCSLPMSSVFTAIINLPKVEPKEFMPVLKASIKKLLPYDVENMVLDYQILEAFSTEKVKRILVSAVPKPIIEFYSKIFNLAGLTLESLEPESLALSRSLIGRDKSLNVLVDMGAERTNLFLIDQTIPITQNTVDVGGNRINRILMNNFGLEENETVQLKHDIFKRYASGIQNNLEKENFINLLLPVFDPIIKQIEYNLGIYLSQTGNEQKVVEKIILSGGSAMVPYFSEYLAEYFKMKCFLGDPWARVVYQDKLKPVLNTIGSRMSVAIGLAMKNLV